MQQLSDRIRFLREQNSYSQYTMARMLCVSRMTYAHYERGDREPSLEILTALASIYHVSLDFLVGLSNIPCIPNVSATEGFLLSQLDRLDEKSREKVFRALREGLCGQAAGVQEDDP